MVCKAIIYVYLALQIFFGSLFQCHWSIDGYLSHELHRCTEVQGKYLLLVRWENLEAHTIRFRNSAEYQEWKRMLHHFYAPFPIVEHFEEVKIKH
ncbi:antibiotic biosynthesis monooxygenase [Microcoleus sp. S36b_A4]|uniref:antibiotic biosynthesis monooxygenase n=1 Tax=Microcoleus sp. S36b_A4 TaxID=3055420 RepID=UPI002FD04288